MRSFTLKHSGFFTLTRRECLSLVTAAPLLAAQIAKEDPNLSQNDWSCPMDADIHLDHAGKCPRCGMTLVLKVPEREEYLLYVSAQPSILQPGQEVRLTLRVLTPAGKPVQHFETVHERVLHLFIVSEDLEFFAHTHPSYRPDGSFILSVRLPKPGMYRILADYYPSGSVPQLTTETLFVKGESSAPRLDLSLAPQQATNLTASLRLEPPQPAAGLLTQLHYTLSPPDGLEKYLGAWGHMLLASEDMVDLLHLHPFLASPSDIQYNVIFPRAGNYKIWSQFQRLGEINTVVFSVKVKEL